MRQHFFTHELPKERKSRVSLRESETKVVSDNYHTLSVDALDWLFDVSSNPTVHSVVVQALGGLPDGVQHYTKEIWRNQDEMRRVRSSLFARSAAMLGTTFYSSVDPKSSSLTCMVGCESVCDRLNRSFLFLPRKAENSPEQWYEVIDDGRDEPHLRASLWLTARSMLEGANETRRDLRAFIASNRDVELHRLMWVHLVETAIGWEMLAPEYLDDSAECATVIDMCFHAARRKTPDYEYRNLLKDKPLTFENVFNVQPTLKDIWRAGVQKETDVFLQDHLLKMLSSHDTLPSSFSPSYRLVLAVGKFGVSHVARYFSAPWVDFDGWRHLHLVDCALNYLNDIIHDEYSGHGLDMYLEQQEFMESIFHFLISVIDTTPVCDYKPLYWEITVIKDLLVHCLLQTVRLCGLFMERFALPPASLKRLLHVPAQHLSQDLGIWRLAVSPRDLNPATDRTLGVLCSRLADGDEIVYRAFVAGDWLKILSGSWVADMNKNRFALSWFCSVSQAFTMHGYIHGLSSLPSEARAEFVEYIHEPRNLVILFLMVATDQNVAMRFYGKDVTTPRIHALMRVCPGHASWAECYATLKGVLEWSRNPDGVQFPLEGFFEGRVVKVDDVEISLDEQLRLMVGQDHVRARLELAEEYVLSDRRAN
ncbi:hypothetical protein BDZ89DRAFT_86668 [Hymenopellis radicata]|nr:hypothetical protein BDZ89DRAFT_86668 [Hymenopellis radicata]